MTRATHAIARASLLAGAAAVATIVFGACGGAQPEPVVVQPAPVVVPEPEPIVVEDEHSHHPAEVVVRRSTELTLEIEGESDASELGLLTDTDTGYALTLSQRSCRFAEAEPNATYEASNADECREINRADFDDRTQQVIRVPAGSYSVRVANDGVPYALGFWLRLQSDPTQTIVSGGGIEPGTSRVYETELAPGRYIYSCPLNPTPDYLLIVTESE